MVRRLVPLFGVLGRFDVGAARRVVAPCGVLGCFGIGTALLRESNACQARWDEWSGKCACMLSKALTQASLNLGLELAQLLGLL